MNIEKHNNWLSKMQLTHPLVIAGPCSAETEEQVLAIAKQLKNTKATVFRAGIWKPRTRPGNFEGVGQIGLQWLQRVKQETGMMIATEVANATHVKHALAHDVDVLWIGARTTVNPFMVQEIADALKGTDKIVLVKNPINPDLALWLGAIERLQQAGITKLGAVHRGFSSYEKTTYRNKPEWQIPIDFKNNYPEIPLICDPSHIGGDSKFISELCQTALDLNFDGFMIETHNTPKQAWSDAAQQVTPEKLVTILDNLKIKQQEGHSPDYIVMLDALREKIDSLDAKLITTLGKRMDVSAAIGQLKYKNDIAILQSNRWNEILQRMIVQGNTKKLSEGFIAEIYKAIHQESIFHQKK